MDDLLDDIRECFIREVYQFTLHLEYLVEQGDITLEELEEGATVNDMFREWLGGDQ